MPSAPEERAHMTPRAKPVKHAQACRRNSIDDVLAKLQALVHEPAPPSADPGTSLARREAIRLMISRLRGEEANPSKDVGVFHRRIYRQLRRADKYGARARPRPWLVDHAARLRAALAYGNSVLAWRQRNCGTWHAVTCEGLLCDLEEELTAGADQG
eukprot:764795-Alexandrium_andersonii.AAC.1